MLPEIWYERPILPDLRDWVESVSVVLGDQAITEADPYAGLDRAVGVMAGVLLYDAEMMDRAPGLRIICRTGIGTDRVDIAEAGRRGIVVCNTPDGPTVSTAEHAVALILAAAKRIERSQHWLLDDRTDMYARHEAVELDGKTLGLIGYGRIARRVGAAASGLGMKVLAYDPFLPADRFEGADQAHSLHELVGSADVVSVHVPMTPENAAMFDDELFSAMKQGAIFVNTARGGLVDQDALLRALDSGRLHSAGLDVTEPEPLPLDHPLLHRDDVVVTPHIASATHDGKRRIFRMALEQVLQFLDGVRPQHIVNPEVWDT